MPAAQTESTVLTAALEYASKGWKVFPCWPPTKDGCGCARGLACERPGKHPLGRLVPNGLLDATSDPALITAWWTQYPLANVAIRTGPESGFWVLDVDAYKGGAFALEELESKHGKLPVSVRARTGSGGASLHILFRYPESSRVPSHPIPGVHGLDVKGAGGYIIAAPSVHRSGGFYCWLDEDDSTMDDAPEWLLRCVSAPVASEPRAPVPTGMELDEEGAEEFCAKFFKRASEKVFKGEGRHDTAGWFFVQCKDNAVPFEHAQKWIEPFHTIAKEMGGRQVPISELKKFLDWAYRQSRRDPLPSVRDRLRLLEEPPDIPWEFPDDVPPDVQASDDEEPRQEAPKEQPTRSPWLSLADALSQAQDVSQRFLTHVPTLDRATMGGIPRGRVMLIVGRPGSGKTTLAIQIVVRMALQGAAVGMLLADEGLNAGAIRVAQQHGYERAKLEAADPDTIKEAADSLRSLDNIFCLDPDDPKSTLDLFIKGMDERAAGRPQVWLLDSAQVIRIGNGTKGADARIRTKEIAERVKSEGRKRAAVVILLSQSNRASYRGKRDEDNADPLSSGAESGALEHMPDVFLWLAPDGPDKIKALIPKNRIGTGPVLIPWHLTLDRRMALFREVDETETPEEDLAKEAKRLERLRKTQQKVLDALKRNPEGLTKKQLRDAVSGPPASIIEAVDTLQAEGKIFSEPTEKRGGGMIWKVTR